MYSIDVAKIVEVNVSFIHLDSYSFINEQLYAWVKVHSSVSLKCLVFYGVFFSSRENESTFKPDVNLSQYVVMMSDGVRRVLISTRKDI